MIKVMKNNLVDTVGNSIILYLYKQNITMYIICSKNSIKSIISLYGSLFNINITKYCPYCR